LPHPAVWSHTLTRQLPITRGAARQTIGPTALLTPEHQVVPTDTEYARAVGRKAIARYLELSNYVN